MRSLMSLLALAGLSLGSFSVSVRQDAQGANSSADVPIKFDGVAMYVVQVKDLDSAMEWYKTILGCNQMMHMPAIGWAEMTSPARNSLIGLSQVKEGQEHQANGGSNLSFGVKNIEVARKWLIEKEVEAEEIQIIPGTVKLLYFNDPDGNRIMLYQAV